MPFELPVSSARIGDASRKPRRDPIRVTLDELIATAEEVGEKTGRTYYATVLRQVKELGLLKRTQGGSAIAADELCLDEVASLVGLVGAGKSVLATMLIVCLAKRGYKVVSLLNSVSDVMESVVLLCAAGVAASPLVSRSRRVERLDEFFDHSDSMLLDPAVSPRNRLHRGRVCRWRFRGLRLRQHTLPWFAPYAWQCGCMPLLGCMPLAGDGARVADFGSCGYDADRFRHYGRRQGAQGVLRGGSPAVRRGLVRRGGSRPSAA